jgi:hypothetical protein
MITTSNLDGGKESVTITIVVLSHVCWPWKQEFLKRKKEISREKHLMHSFA